MSKSIPTVAPRRTPQPIYSPLGIRKCAECGRRDRWRRLEWPPAGGWACCSSLAPRTHDREMAHVCTPVCAGAA